MHDSIKKKNCVLVFFLNFHFVGLPSRDVSIEGRLGCKQSFIEEIKMAELGHECYIRKIRFFTS